MNQFRKMGRTQGLPLLIAILLLCAACAPSATSTPGVVKVYITAAAQPWLAEVSKCAAGSSVILSNASDPDEAEIVLRIGEPDDLTTPAFQIDSEDLLIVVNRESPIQSLSADEAREMFAGQGQADVQIWVYGSGEDIQQVFTREIMRGAQVSSLARLALNPQQMSDALNNEKSAVGIIGRHWKTGTGREVFSLPDVPVLAIIPDEPQGAVKEILACLQK